MAVYEVLIVSLFSFIAVLVPWASSADAVDKLRVDCSYWEALSSSKMQQYIDEKENIQLLTLPVILCVLKWAYYGLKSKWTLIKGAPLNIN